MGQRGPQPKDESDRLVSIGLRVPLSTKQRLVLEVNKRRLAEPTLALTWGLSEYLRDLIAAHVATLPDQTTGKPAAPRRAAAATARKKR